MGARSVATSRAPRLTGLSAAVVAVAMTLPAVGAHANGAFPDSLNILTPATLPHETLLATNFGLVMSFDGEQTWTWSCEQTLNSFATLYQMGASPRNRISRSRAPASSTPTMPPAAGTPPAAWR